jgi:hypothetical protein
MSEGESFLARWSRLKREQALSPSRSDDAQSPPAQALSEHAPSGDAPPRVDEPLPAVDLASLPPIESMGAGSDISAYLGVGVPLELTKAALRSAWRADPAVRDFVEIADNQWDFNTPDAIPGFGAMGAAEEAKSLVARAMTGSENVAATVTPLKPATGSDQPDSHATTVASLEDSRVVDPVWQVGTVPQADEVPPVDMAPRLDAVAPPDAAVPLEAVTQRTAALRLEGVSPLSAVSPPDAGPPLSAVSPPDAATLAEVEQTSVETDVSQNDLEPASSPSGRRGHGSALPR